MRTPDKEITVWVQAFTDRPHLVLQWHDPATGKRKSRTSGTSNEVEAEHRRTELEYELNHGLYAPDSRLTWLAFRALFWTEYVSPKRPNTQTAYGCTFAAWEKGCPARIDQINERSVSAFVAASRTEGLQASSIRLRLQHLRTALRWAVEQGFLGKVPRFPLVRVPKRKPQPVPVEAFERLYEKADRQLQVFLLCGWLAGLRLHEAYALEWEPSRKAPWVDFPRSRIWLPAEFAKAVEDQWVTLAPELAEALQSLPRQGKKVFRFPSCRGAKLTLSGLSRRIVDLAKKAGVALSMHALRRGFICRFAGEVPAQVLRQLARHANIQTTLEFYSNIDAAAEAAILGKAKEVRP